jgi:hypothetical protein
MTRRQRSAVEATIERLIALLDAADGDCDREPEIDFEHDGSEEEGAALIWSIAA